MREIRQDASKGLGKAHEGQESELSPAELTRREAVDPQLSRTNQVRREAVDPQLSRTDQVRREAVISL